MADNSLNNIASKSTANNNIGGFNPAPNPNISSAGVVGSTAINQKQAFVHPLDMNGFNSVVEGNRYEIAYKILITLMDSNTINILTIDQFKSTMATIMRSL